MQLFSSDLGWGDCLKTWRRDWVTAQKTQNEELQGHIYSSFCEFKYQKFAKLTQSLDYHWISTGASYSETPQILISTHFFPINKKNYSESHFTTIPLSKSHKSLEALSFHKTITLLLHFTQGKSPIEMRTWVLSSYKSTEKQEIWQPCLLESWFIKLPAVELQ